MSDQDYDVVVVGAGNAAFCAAISARQHGARVLVLERRRRRKKANRRLSRP
jgi:tricarballylate dehydrogenase